ncbi:MAG: hypothetical protein K2K45_04440 [Muribaculaceae bacterium]|nr:hypothetical protein [Muribaculaceae bacterium]
MKRERIINKVKETAKQITAEAVNVFTCGAIYPKCYLAIVSESISGFDRPGERLTPDMRPTELLAYVQGMAAMTNKH